MSQKNVCRVLSCNWVPSDRFKTTSLLFSLRQSHDLNLTPMQAPHSPVKSKQVPIETLRLHRATQKSLAKKILTSWTKLIRKKGYKSMRPFIKRQSSIQKWLQVGACSVVTNFNYLALIWWHWQHQTQTCSQLLDWATSRISSLKPQQALTKWGTNLRP